MTNTTFVRMSLDTRHFSFEAFAETEEACRELFLTGLQAHKRAYPGAADDFVESCMEDASIMPIKLGQFYRDCTALKLD